MPIRIYALAKELQVDSKELVEICRKAGISGKGSALASLEDDEAKKVRDFISGGGQSAPVEKKAAPAPTASAPPAPTTPPAPTPTTGTPQRAETAADTNQYRREDYIAPTRSSGKIKVLDVKTKKGAEVEPVVAEEATEEPKRKKRERETVINLAEMPEVKQPVAAPSSDEPAPQKPELRLPQDAIKAHREGRAPLEEQMKQTEEKKKPEDKSRRPVAVSGRAGEAETERGRKSGTAKGPRDASTDLANMAKTRRERAQKRREKARNKVSMGDDEGGGRARRRLTLSRVGGKHTEPRKGKAVLELPCTVRSFSEATGVGSGSVIKTLMGMGAMVNINAQIDDEMVDLLAAELGVDLEIRQPQSLETSLLEAEDLEDEPDSLEPRPPIVTFLGHVDHGKTSLLDYIIGINVVKGEAGGITQHIRAYQVDKDGRKIAFVDTPGHEAFTEMRARGANVTDVAVLVIAADDGIMPQTEEAISHAKAANVPIVVALNKIDLPSADANRAMQQLTQHELTPSVWGGDTEVVETSATTGQGMDELLETLLTIAELQEYKANPHRPAVGVCLEAEQEGSRGVMAKLMVQNGTMNVGDVVVCGSAFGRVKAMYDTLKPRTKRKIAGPSVPVNVSGFDEAPAAGERFHVLDDIAKARQIAEQRHDRSRSENLSQVTTKVSFERFQELLEEGRLGKQEEVVNLNLIIRADVRGSIEAIQKELQKLQHPEVQIKILLASVGAITLGDVTLASASQAVVVGFNVIPNDDARMLADDRGVEIRRYDIIYKLTDDIKSMLEGKLKPEERVVDLGHALVKQVFPISRLGAIAGCYVARGSIERGCRIRVNRGGRTIGDYPLESLRREKDDVKEVPRGMECGIKLSGFNDIKQDDILEAYKIEEVARSL